MCRSAELDSAPQGWDATWRPTPGGRVILLPWHRPAYNKELGAKYDQKAVVGFTPDAAGKDAELRVEGGKDPDAFYKALVGVMGSDAGASFDDGVRRVFLYHGNTAEGRDAARKVSKLTDSSGCSVSSSPVTATISSCARAMVNISVMADDDYPDLLPGESLVEWLRRVMPETEDKSAYENPVTSLRFGLGGLVDKAKAAAQR